VAVDMATSLTPVLHFLATYLLHSTVLFGATWFWFRSSRRRHSLFLTESLWKAASMVAFGTTLLQMNCAFVRPLIELSVPWLSSQASLVTSSAAKPSHNRNIRTPGSDVSITKTVRDKINAWERHNSLPWEPVDSVGVEAISWPVTTSDKRVLAVRTEESRPSRGTLPEEAYSAPVTVFQVDRPELAVWSVAAFATLFILFLTGGLMHLICQGVYFRSRLRRSSRLAGEIVRELLDELLQDASVTSRVTLLSCVRLSEPFAFGIVRWHIVLPEGIESRLSRSELKALLAHELAHLVRGDGLWLWWGRLLCTCFPIQPWNFLARRKWQAAAEIQCDDWAVRYTGNALALARCLAKVLEWKNERRSFVRALAVSGARPNVSKRVERLVSGLRSRDPWTSLVRRRCLAGLVVGIGGVLVYWGPTTSIVAQDTVQQIDEAADMTAELTGRIPSVTNTASAFEEDDGQPARTDQTSEIAGPNGSAVRLLTFGDAVTDRVRATEAELQLMEREIERLHLFVSRSVHNPSAREVERQLAGHAAELRLRWDAIREHFE